MRNGEENRQRQSDKKGETETKAKSNIQGQRHREIDRGVKDKDRQRKVSKGLVKVILCKNIMHSKIETWIS